MSHKMRVSRWILAQTWPAWISLALLVWVAFRLIPDRPDVLFVASRVLTVLLGVAHLAYFTWHAWRSRPRPPSETP